MKKILLIIVLLIHSIAFAAHRTIDLTVAYKTVYYAGKPVKAIAVNNQIPAPTLHFKQGDTVTINVHNLLTEETAIHWHGLIVPWQMDGVLGISQHGIPPGGVFHYQFTLHQSGTYWYHAHAGLQEQQGLYGAFLIDPPRQASYHYNKDYVIVLSDWSNTHPNRILANLKKEGDYYSPLFPLQPSLTKFIHDYQTANKEEREYLIDDYKMMQQMCMSIYDLSDVAYNAFLLNGQNNANPWTARVKVGDVVRLRFIGAGASTIFHVKIPGTTMQLIHVDGNNIRPYLLNDFTIAPGETYDVLVKIKNASPYIIYAESKDTVGAAYGALVSNSQPTVNFQQIKAFPEPLPVTREMMSFMMNDTDHSMGPMVMDMPTEATPVSDDNNKTSTGTQYQNIVAAVKTNNPDKPISQTIKMNLFGYMDRYIWFINGVPEYNAAPIVIEPGKRYRIIFTNTSMMHHPMHIHGHWFILRKGNGAYDPLLHTIDIPPGATIVADLDADASGQWLFHCHLLYHMMSGMARVFQYSTLIELTKNEIRPENTAKNTRFINRPIVRIDELHPINAAMVHHPAAHMHGMFFSNHLDLGDDLFRKIQKIDYKGLYGYDFNKIEIAIKDAEIKKGTVENADSDIFYWHLLSQFWSVKGGLNYFYRPAAHPYWQPGIGIEGLMPYFIDTDIRGYFYSGAAKLDMDFSRSTQITNNFFIRLGIRGIFASKTILSAGIGKQLNQMRYIVKPYYRLQPGLDLYAEYEYEKAYGAYKNILIQNSDRGSQNTLTIGISILF